MNRGEHIGSGRCADVFQISPDRVLKLYKPRFGFDWVEQRAAQAESIHRKGVPSPAVHAVESCDGRFGIVLEFIPGVTLWEAVEQNPKRAEKLSRDLADLHVLVHAADPFELPSWTDIIRALVAAVGQIGEPVRAQVLTEVARPGELCVAHSDLHPGNAMVRPDGSLVAIDWDSPRLAPAALEVARSSYLISTWAQSPGAPHVEPVIRHLMADTFVAHYCDQTGLAPETMRAWSLVATAARFAEGIDEEFDVLRQEIEKLTRTL